MPFCTYIPVAPLSEFVDYFCYSFGHEPNVKPFRHLPTGACELIIPLIQNVSQAYACGASSKSFLIDKPPQFEFIGVQFKIGSAFPFFGGAVGELQNLFVPLSEVWDNAAPELTERLLAATQPEEKFKILEQFLLRQAKTPLQKNPVVSWAMQELSANENPLSLADVADQSGYSQRHFINVFRSHVGLTPKVFQRLQRFWHSMHKSYLRPNIDWADLALDCGYYDQAHFIHEFQNFSGIAPSEWLAVRGKSPSHVVPVE